jgi:hypothetical protein
MGGADARAAIFGNLSFGENASPALTVLVGKGGAP